MKEEYDTLQYYNNNAQLYCEQTIVGNLKENYDRFLSSGFHVILRDELRTIEESLSLAEKVFGFAGG